MDMDFKESMDFIYQSYMKQEKTLKKMRNGHIQSFFEYDTGICPICGSRKNVLFPYPSLDKTFKKFYVVGCKECGFCYTKIDDFKLQKYYEHNYSKENRKDREIEPETYFSEDNIINNKLLEKYFLRAKRHAILLRSLISGEITSALDFGSGPGYFLYELKAKYSYAIEHDEESKKYLDYIGAIKICKEQIKDYKFDVIAASHSLEHLVPEELLQVLYSFYESLTDKGFILIEVPHGGILRYNIYLRHVPHTLFFTSESLKLAVAKVGFKNIVVKIHNGGKMAVREDAVYHSSVEDNSVGSIVLYASKV